MDLESFLDAAADLGRALAAAGHADSMVALGIVLLEGIGHDDNPANLAEGHRWIATAAASTQMQTSEPVPTRTTAGGRTSSSRHS